MAARDAVSAAAVFIKPLSDSFPPLRAPYPPGTLLRSGFTPPALPANPNQKASPGFTFFDAG